MFAFHARRYAGQIFATRIRIVGDVGVAAGSGQPTNFEASAKFTSLGYSRVRIKAPDKNGMYLVNC